MARLPEVRPLVVYKAPDYNNWRSTVIGTRWGDISSTLTFNENTTQWGAFRIVDRYYIVGRNADGITIASYYRTEMISVARYVDLEAKKKYYRWKECSLRHLARKFGEWELPSESS